MISSACWKVGALESGFKVEPWPTRTRALFRLSVIPVNWMSRRRSSNGIRCGLDRLPQRLEDERQAEDGDDWGRLRTSGGKNVDIEISTAKERPRIDLERDFRGFCVEREKEFTGLRLGPCLRFKGVSAFLGELNIESAIPEFSCPVCKFY